MEGIYMNNNKKYNVLLIVGVLALVNSIHASYNNYQNFEDADDHGYFCDLGNEIVHEDRSVFTDKELQKYNIIAQKETGATSAAVVDTASIENSSGVNDVVPVDSGSISTFDKELNSGLSNLEMTDSSLAPCIKNDESLVGNAEPSGNELLNSGDCNQVDASNVEVGKNIKIEAEVVNPAIIVQTIAGGSLGATCGYVITRSNYCNSIKHPVVRNVVKGSIIAGFTSVGAYVAHNNEYIGALPLSLGAVGAIVAVGILTR